jgi:hypothetical protein
MLNSEGYITQETYFGILLSIILSVIAILLLEQFSLAFWIVLLSALVFFVAALVQPKIFSLFLVLWLKLGGFLGRLVSPLALFAIFVIGFFTTGLLLRLFGKDLMCKEYAPGSQTYWVSRKDKNIDFRQQF